MTEPQRIAYANPCWRAWETMAIPFVAVETFRGRRFSRVLSINK